MTLAILNLRYLKVDFFFFFFLSVVEGGWGGNCEFLLEGNTKEEKKIKVHRGG